MYSNQKSIDQISIQDIRRNLRFFSSKTHLEQVCLSGGEPTLREDLDQILSYVSEICPDSIYLHTDAIAFSDEVYAEKLLPKVNRIMASLHSWDSQSTKKICGINNFKKRIKGLKIIGKKTNLTINTILLEENYKNLLKIVNLIVEIHPERVKFTLPYYRGRAANKLNLLAPLSFEKLKRFLKKAKYICEEHGIEVRFQGFPLCYLKQFGGVADQWKERFFVDHNFQLGNCLYTFKNIVSLDKKDEECSNCDINSKCWGYIDAYIQFLGYPQPRRVSKKNKIT